MVDFWRIAKKSPNHFQHCGFALVKEGKIIKIRFMENHIKLTSGLNSNSYIRQFQVAQLNLYLFSQEEETKKKKFRFRNSRSKTHESH